MRKSPQLLKPRKYHPVKTAGVGTFVGGLVKTIRVRKSPADVLFEIISREAERGWILADHDCGISYIRREDITEETPSVFAVRFRCPIGCEGYGIPAVIERVCAIVGSPVRYICDKRREYGLPYIECAWVVAFSPTNNTKENQNGTNECQ